MGIDMSVFYQDMVSLASMIITALVGVGIVYLRKFVNSKVASQELKESLLLTLSTVEDAVKASVSDLDAEVRKALEDGTITEEERKHLLLVAEREVNNTIGSAAKDRLQAHVADVDKLIQNKVKSAVDEMVASVK
jgi:hypothetical protein